MCVFKESVGRVQGWEHQCRFFRELLQMLLHWRLCLHMVLSFQALTQSLARQIAIGQTRSLIVIEDSWWHCYPTGLYVCFLFVFFFFFIPSSSQLLHLAWSSLSTVIYFLSLFEDVCCMLSATGKKKDVCVFSKCQGTRGHSPLNWVFPHT